MNKRGLFGGATIDKTYSVYIEEDGGVEADIVYRQNGEKILLVIPSQEENVVFPPIIKASSLCVLPEELEKYEKEVLHSAQNLQKQDLGEKISKWAEIAKHLDCSISKAKNLLGANQGQKKRKGMCKCNVLQGGNVPGGVWAWSKELDYINDNPVSTQRKKKEQARKKQIAEEKNK